MRRMELPGCFCSSVALSVLASQSKRSGRDVLIIASESGKTKDRGGCEFRKDSAKVVFYCGTSRVVIGCMRRDMLGRDLR